MNQHDLMAVAIAEARLAIQNHEGGPFGAVIARHGKIVGQGRNQVLATGDPTAHAEIQAIRAAAAAIGREELAACDIYSTCEPCPMCMAAIHWARLRNLYFGCTGDEAAQLGFDDRHIRNLIGSGASGDNLEVTRLDADECRQPFKEWQENEDRKLY